MCSLESRPLDSRLSFVWPKIRLNLLNLTPDFASLAYFAHNVASKLIGQGQGRIQRILLLCIDGAWSTPTWMIVSHADSLASSLRRLLARLSLWHNTLLCLPDSSLGPPLVKSGENYQHHTIRNILWTVKHKGQTLINNRFSKTSRQPHKHIITFHYIDYLILSNC